MQQTKHQILYIDDEKENLENFRFIFFRDYTIHLALSAERAFEIIKKNPVKVIISDQRMPNMTGVEFFEKIRKSYPDIIRIILTAYTDEKDVLEAINKGGVYRYITKPWKKQEVKVTIQNAVEAYDLKHENQQLLQNLKKSNKELRFAYQQIKQSEEKFKNIFNNSLDAIFITDLKGNILEINESFSRSTGFTKETILSMNMQQLPMQNHSNTLKKYLEDVHNNGKSSIEVHHLTPKGKNIFIEINSTLINFEGKSAILHFARNITERKEIQQKILNAIIETEENERNHFAQELHDGLGPVLSTIKLYIQAIRDNKNPEKSNAISDKAINTVNEALQSVTEISNNISPHILRNFGLIPAIKSFIMKVTNTGAVNIDFRTDIKSRFAENVEITMYRVIVELINNTLKHAQAGKITIKLKKRLNTLQLFYADDGKGFDVKEKLSKKQGMGLFNMENRIKTLKGKLNINSAQNSGTKVLVELSI